MKRLYVAAALAALSIAGCERREAAEAPPPPPPVEQTLSLCDAFKPDTSAADLAARFGAESVQDATIEGGEGQRFAGMKLFPGDPTREVEITWHDPVARKGVATAAVYHEESRWRGPGDVAVGDSLDDVEAANGGPFRFYGFGWDFGGTVGDWMGGALGGECRLIAMMSPETAPPPAEVSGDRLFSSVEEAVRATKPTVAMIAVGWPPPTVEAPPIEPAPTP